MPPEIGGPVHLDLRLPRQDPESESVVDEHPEDSGLTVSLTGPEGVPRPGNLQQGALSVGWLTSAPRATSEEEPPVGPKKKKKEGRGKKRQALGSSRPEYVQGTGTTLLEGQAP